MDITILGTSSMVPTKQRAPSAVYLSHQGVGVLFDCGEGTQRQMNINGINRNNVNIICISHWHADHVAGLLGLLQTVNSKPEGHHLVIIGPPETQKRLDQLMHSTIYDDRLTLDIIEQESQEPEVAYQTSDITIHTVSLQHSTPVIGFSFVVNQKIRIDTQKQQALGLPDGPHLAQLQRGETITYNGKTITPEDMTYIKPQKKFTYVTDTAFCQQAIDLAEDSDILVAESTFANKHENKAAEYLHMTAQQSAQIASMSNSKRLVLTHFSQRYPNVQELVDEAKEVFPQTVAAYDFMKLDI